MNASDEFDFPAPCYRDILDPALHENIAQNPPFDFKFVGTISDYELLYFEKEITNNFSLE